MKKLISIIAALTIAASAIAAPSFEVKVSGSGSPIIFIPGLTCDGTVWDETIARYSDTNECHVLSLAGFASQVPTDLSNGFLKTVESEIIAYLSENAINQPVIVGHSLGGFLALQIAIDHPDLARSLLIVDSLPFLPAAMNPAATAENTKLQAEAQKDMISKGGQNEAQLRMMLQMMITSPENQERALKMGTASDPKTVAQAVYELSTIDLRQDVSKIKTPTTILGAWYGYAHFGATKETTTATFTTQYAKLPDYRLVMSERGKHFIMWDDPELFYSELDVLLK